jgi:hypothetical protein
MTAKVFEFKKPNGDKPHHRASDPATVNRLRTNPEIFSDVIEDILGHWQSAAAKNKLNEYIRSKIPPMLVGDLDKEGAYNDFVNDLNVISIVEQKLGMRVAVFYPGCTFNNPYGWLAAFHRGKEIYSTPPDMASEANARALNILLHLSFEYTMKSLGRD